MFPEPTELRLIGCSIESNFWTPKSKSSTFDTKKPTRRHTDKKEISHVMNENHVLCLFNICHFNSTNCLEVMSKRTKKRCKWWEESQQNRSRWWIWSRDAAKRILICLLFSAPENPVKTRYKSQIPLCSWTEQQTRTGRLVKDACSSSYSENGMLTKSGLVKSGNLPKCSKQEWRDLWMNNHRVCSHSTRTNFCWWRWHGLQHRHRIRLFVKIQIILAQGGWSIAKDVGQILKRCNTRQSQTFFNIGNVYVFDIGSIYSHGKGTLRKFTLHQKYREQSHNETDVWQICKVQSRTIRWDLLSDSN